jgi:Ala-tRNA(Pro) deacylase
MAQEAYNSTLYERLRSLLEANGVPYRELAHAAEGQSERVAALRGNRLEQGAKAMLVLVKMDKHTSRYVLVVVPSDRRVALEAVRRLVGGARVLLTPSDRARAISGCEMGAVPPVSFDPAVSVIFDAALAAEPEIFFNAGRLDRSFAADTRALIAATKPIVADVAEPAPHGPGRPPGLSSTTLP